MGRGPIAASAGRWNGITVAKDRAVLSYTVAGTEVSEQIGSVAEGAQVGITRTFRTGTVAQPLTLVVADVGGGVAASTEGATTIVYQGAARDTATVAGVVGAPAGARLQVDSNRFVTLRLPAGAASTFRVVAWRGAASDRAVVSAMLRRPVAFAPFERGGARRWDSTVTTRRRRLTRHRGLRRRSRRAADPQSVAAKRARERRRLLPRRTRRRRHLRRRRVDRLGDRPRARPRAVESASPPGCTSRSISRSCNDTIYVLDRQGIVRLLDVNGDGEADRYENFSNLVIQSGESREFPLGMAREARRRLLRRRSAARSTSGPRRRRPIMPGFRAGSRHSGTVQEVSADGRSHPHVRQRPARAEHRRASAHGADRVVRPAGQLRSVHADVPPARGRLLRRSADRARRRHDGGASAAGVDPARGGRLRRRRGVGHRKPDGLRGRRARAPVVRAARAVPRLPRQHAERACRARSSRSPASSRRRRSRAACIRATASSTSPDSRSGSRTRKTSRASRGCATPAVRARSRSPCMRDSRGSSCASRSRLDAAAARDAARYQLQSWSYRAHVGLRLRPLQARRQRGARSLERRARTCPPTVAACSSSCRRCGR